MFDLEIDSDDNDRLQKYQEEHKIKSGGKLSDELSKHYIIRIKFLDNLKLYIANTLPSFLQNTLCGSVCF